MKTTKKNIEIIPRKILRASMFNKRDGGSGLLTKETLSIYGVSEKQNKSIIPFFESKKTFTDWKGFEVKWDIGFGDAVISEENRKEKWFLKNKGKSEIVKRPKNYWEKEAERLNVSTHELYKKQSKMEGLTMNEFLNKYF